MNFEPTSSATATSASDASRYVSGPARSLTPAETDLIGALLDGLPNGMHLRNQLAGALVQDMNDGGMGSIRFVGDRHGMARQAVSAHATDEDGVPLDISINLDESGQLFELDIWKVDFSPLKRIPNPMQVQRVTASH